MSSTQFTISKLQQDNNSKLLEALVVFIASFFGIALLPQLLVRYVYANQPLLETPMALEIIPVVFFAIAIGYFAFVIVGNFIRSNRIKLMERDLMERGDCCCGGDCHSDDMSDIEELVKEVEASMPATAELSEALKKSSKTATSSKKKSNRKKTSKSSK